MQRAARAMGVVQNCLDDAIASLSLAQDIQCTALWELRAYIGIENQLISIEFNACAAYTYQYGIVIFQLMRRVRYQCAT